MQRLLMTLLTLAWLALLAVPAGADEIVETTDGRKLLLRPDGIYEFLSRLDPAIVARALATGKQWADDMTLAAFCLRGQAAGELLIRNFPKDRDEALTRLRRAGATEQQLRQVATVMAENFRTSSGREDKALTEACSAKDVANSIFALRGVGTPISLRPPFSELR